MSLPIVTVTLNPAIDQTLSIDGFAVGRVNRVTASDSHPGGKGVNVTAMLADLGAAVTVTGWLGSTNAEPFQLLCAQKRIDDQFLRIPGETRRGIKITDPTSGQTTDINFPGLRVPPTAADQLLRKLETLVQPGSWTVLAGSIPPGVDAEIYARLVEAVKAKGGLVALDTSGEPLRHALTRAPDLVKPNAAELSEFVGRDLHTPAELVAAARETMIAKGVTWAVVSMGGDGAVFVTADAALRTHAPAVAVQSTVGAGDAMVAGLVFALSRGQTLAEAAKLATALGTYAVTRVVSGLETPDAQRQYFDQIVVDTL